MAKTANLYARIEPEVKEQAEAILLALGIPASSAINMFYKQIILQRGLPFEVKMPNRRPMDVSELSGEAFDGEGEKGLADIKAGRTKSAKAAFEDLPEGLWFMTYDVRICEEADIDLEVSLNISLLSCRHQKSCRTTR